MLTSSYHIPSGFTVVGKNPVYMQEVEEGGPAWEAGLRVNDQIRAVNGQECTNMAHHEVVGTKYYPTGIL